MCTTCFNIRKLCILPTECIYVFRMVLTVFLSLSLAFTLEHKAYVKRFVSLHFLNPKTDCLDGGSTRRKAATYTGEHQQRINADRHPCLQ
jgi:hypothetical protein